MSKYTYMYNYTHLYTCELPSLDLFRLYLSGEWPGPTIRIGTNRFDAVHLYARPQNPEEKNNIF